VRPAFSPGKIGTSAGASEPCEKSAVQESGFAIVSDIERVPEDRGFGFGQNEFSEQWKEETKIAQITQMNSSLFSFG
jgi:hypothetical protein